MTQKNFRHTKDIVIKKFTNIHFLIIGAILAAMCIFAFYLMIALINFSIYNLCCSQTSWYSLIYNIIGHIEFWFTDTIFLIFGLLAYALPIIILFFCWSIFIQLYKYEYVNLFILSLHLIGSLTMLLTSCGLVALNVRDFCCFASGGIIGHILIGITLSYFNSLICITVILLCIWTFGLTLFTGWSWLTISEKIGLIVINCLKFIFNKKWIIINNNNDLLLQLSKVKSLLYLNEISQNNCDTIGMKHNLSNTTDTTYSKQHRNYQISARANCSTNNQSFYKYKSVPFNTSDIEENKTYIINNRLQNNIDIPYNYYDFTIKQQKHNKSKSYFAKRSRISLTSMPIFSIKSNNYNLQIKRDIYLEEPVCQKKLCISVQHKLASYGIKIPSCQQSIELKEEQKSIKDKNKLAKSVNITERYKIVGKNCLHKEGLLVQNHTFIQSNKKIPTTNNLFNPFLIYQEHSEQKIKIKLPTTDILISPLHEEKQIDMLTLEKTARLVESLLADYRIKAKVVGISPGPVITRFELSLAPGVKASRISNLSRDLARSLSVMTVRVVEVIPGKPYVGLELPNKYRQTVYLREVIDCEKFRNIISPLTVVLGKDISGQPVIADLIKMPHLLIAGTTGSGKSVGVNAMILSILYKATPKEVRFIMIDPKMLELSVYEGIPHLLTKVVTDMKDAANVLRWCIELMEQRYKIMSSLGVRNLASYNEYIEQAKAIGKTVHNPLCNLENQITETSLLLEKLPYIVIIVDEFADLIMTDGKKVEEFIARLAQKARAAGIHLVLATQRPSVDVITGLIKANVPARIAFTVSSKIDSRTILDQMGAEALLGMGDMLYLAPNFSLPMRVHGAFVHDEEVNAVVHYWKSCGQPQYIDIITSDTDDWWCDLNNKEEVDPLLDQTIAFVIDKRRASISGVQRQFRIGYNRAARIIEQMELKGIVSPPKHNGNREILLPPLQK